MSSKQPTHIAHIVIEPKRRGQKSIWRRVGSVWPHENGNGFDLVVDDQIAVMGRIVCTEPKDWSDEQPEQVTA
jgi:hypothetical protein